MKNLFEIISSVAAVFLIVCLIQKLEEFFSER